MIFPNKQVFLIHKQDLLLEPLSIFGSGNIFIIRTFFKYFAIIGAKQRFKGNFTGVIKW